MFLENVLFWKTQNPKSKPNVINRNWKHLIFFVFVSLINDNCTRIACRNRTPFTCAMADCNCYCFFACISINCRFGKNYFVFFLCLWLEQLANDSRKQSPFKGWKFKVIQIFRFLTRYRWLQTKPVPQRSNLQRLIGRLHLLVFFRLHRKELQCG